MIYVRDLSFNIYIHIFSEGQDKSFGQEIFLETAFSLKVKKV